MDVHEEGNMKKTFKHVLVFPHNLIQFSHVVIVQYLMST